MKSAGNNCQELEANVFCFRRCTFPHWGRLLHALLWAHSKASVLPTSWSRNSEPLGLIPPGQGCEHLSVMSFIHLQWQSKTRTCLIYVWCFEKYYASALLKVYCKKYELLLSLPFYISVLDTFCNMCLNKKWKILAYANLQHGENHMLGLSHHLNWN